MEYFMYYLIVILKLVQSMLWYDKVLLVTFLSCTCIVWVNKPNAGFFLFFLYLYAHSIHCNIFGTLTKCAEICFNRTYLILYCMHLKWCIPRSVKQIYALYSQIPWSFICSFNKKWNSLFHRGWYTCFMTCYRLVLTRNYFKGFKLTNNIFR